MADVKEKGTEQAQPKPRIGVPSNPAAPAAVVPSLHKFSFRTMQTMASLPHISNASRFVAHPETQDHPSAEGINPSTHR